MTDIKQALAKTMDKKPSGTLSFLEAETLNDLSKGASDTIDFLFGKKKGPKTTMITKAMSDRENILIAASEDTAL